jgi:Putative zinc dependent peptidase (DUF5700)
MNDESDVPRLAFIIPTCVFSAASTPTFRWLPNNVSCMKNVRITSIVLALVMFCSSQSHGKTLARLPPRRAPVADFTQAEMMLRLLQSSAPGQISSKGIDSVLDAYGTSLIIRQQNISRSVTKDQYKFLLINLTREEPPDIAPVDASERARRGVEGLRKDVWAALQWGRANIPLLADRIREIKKRDLFRSSTALAARFLPESVRLAPHLYVVMGGRAGAATLEGDDIYFDVLVTSYRAANGTLKYPTASQLNEYFAHEVHHLGLSQILQRSRKNLQLNQEEQRAFDFLTALVMEGSASYIINGHRNLSVMRRDPQFTESLNKGDELLALSEQLLRSVLENKLNAEAYERSITPFLGSGWHSAGAIMFAAIDRADGLNAIMKVLRDPRKLLVTYNEAIVKLKLSSKQQHFDNELAERISAMGKRV